ncbi:tRNA lysidine(34) synthetase TilS [Modicisalibacter coralii]|uniref:tRNA lysidine(34) synthetase TilS n=1 Tax=Modicisalibacter coralii TaxID=2304602 RepID=UPI00100B1D70|nr:tRNA lysidine(34) synthetase TilS [Halomonas coralii]
MFLQATIDRALAETAPGRVVWVALSGGLDSCLLLALVAEAARRHPRPIHALHVDHGLQSAAADFERHCRRLCSRLGVPLFVERVSVELAGEGLEAAAREARYAAFARRVAPGEALWLAQHADDQAETFLLAALRGSGVRGLAAMPERRDWRGRDLARPLLGLDRSRLAAVAADLGLSWCEDPSNADTRLDRNYLRHAVLPRLAERWPQVARSLGESARRAAEADGLLDEFAAIDLRGAGGDPARLGVAALTDLSRPRQRLLVRHACQRLGLPTPPAARLEALLDQLAAREDAEVHVVWPGGEGRRWRGRLYLQAPAEPLPVGWRAPWNGQPGRVGATAADPGVRVDWRLTQESGGVGELRLTGRRGGEMLRVAGRGRRDVKRLLQEAGIPPWRRGSCLLAWQGETLVAVLGVAVAEGWCQAYCPTASG